MYKAIIPISFLVLLVSFWKRNDLGEDLQRLNILQQAPIQEAIIADEFSVSVKDKNYNVKPLYEYELYGLVVSYQFHDGNYGLHKSWGDHLNVADICVVWQDSAFSNYLADLDFWNGQFTCNVHTYSNQAWASFNMNQLSNNHLISADEFIRDQITDVSIGDQIKITGWLASYGNENHDIRGTSTTREDTGNGACETIYVNDFEIIRHYTNVWKKLMYCALLVLIISIIGYFRQPFKIKQ